jgi:hypothetical protein
MRIKAALPYLVLLGLAVAGCRPVIVSVVPDRGPVGTEVTIEGRNFDSTPAANTVKFGGVAVPAQDISQASPTTLKVKVPKGAATGPVSVAAQGGENVGTRLFAVGELTGKPDLVPKNLTVGGANQLYVDISNEGENEVPQGQGRVDFFVDGKLMSTVRLADLADQSYRSPGGKVTLSSGLWIAGKDRRIAVVVDPENAIDESNEFQNTLTRTLTPPMRHGPDLIVSDIVVLTSTRFHIVVQNIGPADTPTSVPAVLEGSVDSHRVTPLHLTLPTIPAGGTHRVEVTSPYPLDRKRKVVVTLRVLHRIDDIDNTNNRHEVILPGGPSLDPYLALLGQQKIQNNVIWEGRRGSEADVVQPYASWTAGQKAALNHAILALEQGKTFSLAAPPALIGGEAISEQDAWTIFLAHIAQSLWVEVHRLVPWRLADFNDAQLAFLLDGRWLFSFLADSNTYAFRYFLMGFITDWNPQVSYEFLSNLNLIRPTQQETIFALTDWMRGHLIHISSDTDKVQQYGYAGFAPADKILYPLEGRKHITEGCSGTTGLYGAVLRAVNVPVERADVLYENGFHVHPVLPSVDLTLFHGDDPYDANLHPSGAVVPSSKMLWTTAEFNALIVTPPVDCVGSRCNPPGVQASYNMEKAFKQLAFDYMTDYLLYTYAHGGPVNLESWLTGRDQFNPDRFVKPLFSDAERIGMTAAVMLKVTEIGGGDIEAGKTIVIDRVNRFYENQ